MSQHKFKKNRNLTSSFRGGTIAVAYLLAHTVHRSSS